MSLRLLGKIAVITGTGGGVGREAALLFAKEGAAIVGCDIDADAASHTVEMVKYEGGTMVSLHPRDLTDPSDCQALIDLALRTFGQIDVLFSSAAFATFNWMRGHRRRGVGS